MRKFSIASFALTYVIFLASSASGDVLLYSQDFESPNGFVNDGGDINIFRTVNQLYGGQPAGFQFAQNFTVETLLIGGSQAFGTGYTDPSGRGGKYALGMLSDFQNDMLGLAFNIGQFHFLNLRIDISSIDLDRFSGPFVPSGGEAPVFQFSLYDNPSGANGLGSGMLLDSFEVTGLASSSKSRFNFTTAIGGLDAADSTNGNVILRIDLRSGKYASMDNFRITASDVSASVPEPAPWKLLLLGSGIMGGVHRLRGRKAPARNDSP